MVVEAAFPTQSSFGVGYDSPSAAMALGGVPGLMELGLDGLGGQTMGSLGSLGRGDEDERKRRLGMVVDILKVRSIMGLQRHLLIRSTGEQGTL